MRNCGQLILPIVLTACFLVAGCKTPILKPGTVSYGDFVVPCERDQVFDDALKFAQAYNLSAAVLEKSSGLIKFELVSIQPSVLDAYCEFPFRDPETGSPWATFLGSRRLWLSPVSGKVRLNLLMSENGSKSTSVNIRGNWNVRMADYDGDSLRTIPLDSTGVLEAELQKSLTSACAGKNPPTGPTPVEVFSTKFEALMDKYYEGDIKEKDYLSQRDALFKKLHEDL